MLKKVVTIGGGGGHSAVVSAIKDLSIELTCLVNTVDDGGGSGQLVRDYGVHSPGDIGSVLEALGGENLKKRFEAGHFKGQTLGNILLASLELTMGSIQEAIDLVREYYNIGSSVIPITESTPVLCARTVRGRDIRGQENIVKHIRSNTDEPYDTLWLEPKDVSLSSKARTALIEADCIIIAMGDLYSSISPAFCIEELQALWPSLKAKVIWLPNIMITPGHVHYNTTSGALRFVQLLCTDFEPDIIVVHTGKINEDYKKVIHENGYSVSKVDLDGDNLIKVNLFENAEVRDVSSVDLVDRSPILYNPETLKKVFRSLIL